MRIPAVFLLTLSVGIIGSNSLVLSPIAAAVAGSFGDLAPPAVMIAAAAYGLGTAVSALVLAPLGDRYGANRVLLRALLVLVGALGVSAVAPVFWMLCLAQAIAGMAAGVALPSIYSLAAQVAPKGRESETLGIVLTGWTISLVAGVSLSAVLADLVHWRSVYGGLSILALAVALMFAGVRAWGEAPARGQASSPLTAMRVPGIGRGLLVCASYMTAFYGYYSYLGSHVEGVLGYATAVAGLLPLAYGIGFGVAVPLDRLVDRHGPAQASLVTFTALALIYGALGLLDHSLMAMVGLCFAWGLANHIGLNLIVGRLTALDPSQRGAIMGLYGAVTYMCVFVGTVLFRPIYDTQGLWACAMLSALFIVLALGEAIGARRRAVIGASG